MGDFLYPLAVAISRPNTVKTSGDSGHFGLEQTEETVIAAGVPASIQVASRGSRGEGIAKAASDAGPTMWRVFFPFNYRPSVPFQIRDVVTDNFGRRFQVSADQFDSFGYVLMCERLTA